MRTTRPISEILRLLSEMPFLGRPELATFLPMSASGVYRAVERLEDAGLVASLPHTIESQPHTERFHLTAAGIREAARLQDKGVDEFLRTRPVTSQWQRLLLGRLDAAASLYALAERMHLASPGMRLRIYRAAALDAAAILPDGRVIGIMRWGLMADRTAFTKRMERFHNSPAPGGLMLLVPDDIHLRYASRLLSRQRIPAFVAVEGTFISADDFGPVWYISGTDTLLDVEAVISRVPSKGRLLTEPPLSRVTMPDDVSAATDLGKASAHLLPATLHSADKRVLDMIADWPCIRIENLSHLIDLNPTSLSHILGRLREGRLLNRFYVNDIRLALSDRGLGLLARRDRASVGMARRRWSISETGEELSHFWHEVPGRRARQLLRHVGHTDAVHSYLASMVVSAREQGWDVVQIDPPHRASRYFMYQGGQRSIHPDAFLTLRRDGETMAFFLEYERRAVRPSTMRERLAPYLRYYSTKRPLDDHGVTPTIVIVLEDEITASHFYRVAEQVMREAGVSLPLVVREEDSGRATAGKFLAEVAQGWHRQSAG